MELKERLIEAFKEMRDDELISLWNEYCYASNHYDDEILDYDRLEEWANNSNDDTMSILNRFYFGSDEEIQESKENFINDLLNNRKEHYIAFIDEEIENIKPIKYGCYDFELIRQYEDIKNRIENI